MSQKYYKWGVAVGTLTGRNRKEAPITVDYLGGWEGVHFVVEVAANSKKALIVGCRKVVFGSRAAIEKLGRFEPTENNRGG